MLLPKLRSVKTMSRKCLIGHRALPGIQTLILQLRFAADRCIHYTTWTEHSFRIA